MTRLTLRGLGDMELLEPMKRAAGHDTSDEGLASRDALLAETDGNPFAPGAVSPSPAAS